MESTIALLKDNALVAFMFLVTALYLGGDNDDLRAEMRAGFAEIRAEIAEARVDLTAIRAEMAANNQAIRAEMAEEFKAVRAEIANTNERLARVESRLDSIEDRLYMDTARSPM